MKKITSLSNKQLRIVRDLIKKPRLRRELGLFVSEGERLCMEIPAEYIDSIFLSEDYRGQIPEGFSELEKAGRVYQLLPELMRQISDTKTSQGILCLARMKKPEKLRGNFFLLLETIQDPGNLGTIFRTAEAAGVSGIIMNRECVDVYSPKVVRSTMGSLYRMPFVITAELPAVVDSLKKRGVTVYAAQLDGERMHYDCDFSAPTAFLIGNEGNGLSEEISAGASEHIRIPMEGGVESLNAATAATVLMYETLRQRRTAG